jgi:large subunit ribosomal protein L22
MPASRAFTELRFLPKRASLPMEKLLKSAIANAKHNFNLDEKNLRVKQVIVDAGPILKRTDPRAFGRAALIRHRLSHITLTLDEVTPSARKSSKSHAGQAPEVRRAALEELREIEKADKEAEKARPISEGETTKGRGKGFRGRIFNRKSV